MKALAPELPQLRAELADIGNVSERSDGRSSYRKTGRFGMAGIVPNRRYRVSTRVDQTVGINDPRITGYVNDNFRIDQVCFPAETLLVIGVSFIQSTVVIAIPVPDGIDRLDRLIDRGIVRDFVVFARPPQDQHAMSYSQRVCLDRRNSSRSYPLQ